MGRKRRKKSSATCQILVEAREINLLDDVVEEAVRELGLDLLFEPPVRCEVGDISFVAIRARAASEEPDDATIPRKNDRPRITSLGELGVILIITADGNLDRGGLTDAVVVIIAAGGRLETVDATNGGPCG